MSSFEESTVHPPEFEPNRQIFPEPAARANLLGQITLSHVTPVYNRLVTLSDESLRSRLTVREYGASSDLLTQIYATGVTEWQQTAGHLPDDQAVFWHKVGLLYGTQLVTDRYQSTMHKPLAADHPEAYALAWDMVQNSYTACKEHFFTSPDYSVEGYIDSLPPWDREKEREGAFFGSSILMVMSVLLQDRTGGAAPYGDLKAAANRDTALYAGLLDAAILGDAYANFRHGVTMEAKNWIEIGSAPRDFDYRLRERQSDGRLMELPPLHISAMDGLDAALGRLKVTAKDICWRTVQLGSQVYPALFLRNLVQTRLDHFDQVHAIVAILREHGQPYPWDEAIAPLKSPFLPRLNEFYQRAEQNGEVKVGSARYAVGLAGRLQQVTTLQKDNQATVLEVSPPLDSGELSEVQAELLQAAIRRWVTAE